MSDVRYIYYILITILFIFVVVLPHIGSATIETREEMSRVTAKNILAVLNNTPESMPAQVKL